MERTRQYNCRLQLLGIRKRFFIPEGGWVKTISEAYWKWFSHNDNNGSEDAFYAGAELGFELAKEEDKQKIEKLKLLLKNMVNEGFHSKYTLGELSVLVTRETLEKYFLETQKLARQTLKEIDEEGEG